MPAAWRLSRTRVLKPSGVFAQVRRHSLERGGDLGAQGQPGSGVYKARVWQAARRGCGRGPGCEGSRERAGRRSPPLGSFADGESNGGQRVDDREPWGPITSTTVTFIQTRPSPRLCPQTRDCDNHLSNDCCRGGPKYGRSGRPHTSRAFPPTPRIGRASMPASRSSDEAPAILSAPSARLQPHSLRAPALLAWPSHPQQPSLRKSVVQTRKPARVYSLRTCTIVRTPT